KDSFDKLSERDRARFCTETTLENIVLCFGLGLVSLPLGCCIRYGHPETLTAHRKIVPPAFAVPAPAFTATPLALIDRHLSFLLPRSDSSGPIAVSNFTRCRMSKSIRSVGVICRQCPGKNLRQQKARLRFVVAIRIAHRDDLSRHPCVNRRRLHT